MAYNPKLFIGVNNSQDFVPSQFFWTWERMEKPYFYHMSRQSDSFPTIRNNKMVKKFLASNCDIMVKMDIDQRYPPDYLSVMVPLVEEYKVIGPLLYNKWRRTNFQVLMCRNNPPPTVSRDKFKSWSGIEEVPYAHTNLFFARETLKDIPQPWYEDFFNPQFTMREKNGDFEFLDKIKAQGYKIYINTDVLVQHLVMAHVDTRLHKIWNAGKVTGL